MSKPKPLKQDLCGCWRRIEKEHLLVSQILEEKIKVLTCRYY